MKRCCMEVSLQDGYSVSCCFMEGNAGEEYECITRIQSAMCYAITHLIPFKQSYWEEEVVE